MNDCILKFATPGEVEDLKQDVFIALLDKPTTLIQQLHEDGVLFIYSIKVASNIYKKNRSKKKIFVECVTDYVDSENIGGLSYNDVYLVGRGVVIADTPFEQSGYDQLIQEFQELDKEFQYPYFTELIKAIVKHGSQRKVSEVTGIPIRSINGSVHKVRQYLKSRL